MMCCLLNHSDESATRNPCPKLINDCCFHAARDVALNSVSPICLYGIALKFIADNRRQVETKANACSMEIVDVTQNIHQIFLEKGPFYDPTRGGLREYIFGHLHHLLIRQTIGPLRYASSISDEVIEQYFHDGQEYSDITCFENIEMCDVNRKVPGHEKLSEIADLISGKSSAQLAALRKKSKRRMNQILAEIRQEALVQFDLKFMGEQK